VFFKQVDIFKPKSSRESSVEHFVVAKFFDPPKGYCLKDINTFKVFSKELIDYEKVKEDQMETSKIDKINENVYNYVTCGNLNCYDEDIPETDESDVEE